MSNIGAMPNISIPRSRRIQTFNHSTSFLHGDLIPIDCFEVISGDSYKLKTLSSYIHMSTPIFPIFGNINVKVVSFFVPMRLLWDHWEEFFGANKTSSGPQSTVYSVPMRSLYSDGIAANSISHYLGKPVVAQDNTKTNYGKVSILKERAYWLIANEWYRAQQIQDPWTIYKTDNGAHIVHHNGVSINLSTTPFKVCKQADIFTTATTSPQYGAAVELPLGSYAPVVGVGTTGSSLHSMKDGVVFGQTISDTPSAFGPTFVKYSDMSLSVDSTVADADKGDITYSNLMADLSSATAAKINDIRYAFQVQKYLERANYGSRYFEVLAVHYGVTSPDARLQRPEYLGGYDFPINIRTVLSTAGYDAGTSQKVGQPGASSITSNVKRSAWTKGFVEPGYVFVMLSTTHERSYSQGLLKEDIKSDRFEFYSPEFANLGDQEVLNSEIMLTGDSTDAGVFGYRGHWDEYRFRQNRVSGLLDPNVSGSLSYMTLAEKFTSRPSLSPSFIVENRDDISRCLVTGNAGPDYVADFFFEYEATREVPVYAVPGLVDHFGAM